MTSFTKMKQDEFEALVATKGKEAVAWLIDQYAIEVPTPIYPKVKGADGKMKADKSQAPKMEMRPKSFIAIKSDFAKKFAPELAPKRQEKTEVKRNDRIAALKQLLETL